MTPAPVGPTLLSGRLPARPRGSSRGRGPTSIGGRSREESSSRTRLRFLDQGQERRVRLQEVVDEVIVVVRLEALDGHEAMVGQLDDQGIARNEALSRCPPRV